MTGRGPRGVEVDRACQEADAVAMDPALAMPRWRAGTRMIDVVLGIGFIGAAWAAGGRGSSASWWASPSWPLAWWRPYPCEGSPSRWRGHCSRSSRLRSRTWWRLPRSSWLSSSADIAVQPRLPADPVPRRSPPVRRGARSGPVGRPARRGAIGPADHPRRLLPAGGDAPCRGVGAFDGLAGLLKDSVIASSCGPPSCRCSWRCSARWCAASAVAPRPAGPVGPSRRRAPTRGCRQSGG